MLLHTCKYKFYMHWETNKQKKPTLWLTLLQYLLCCSDLERGCSLWGLSVYYPLPHNTCKNSRENSSVTFWLVFLLQPLSPSFVFFFFKYNSQRNPLKTEARSCHSAVQNPAVALPSLRVETKVLKQPSRPFLLRPWPSTCLWAHLLLSPDSAPATLMFSLLLHMLASCFCLTACVSALPHD